MTILGLDFDNTLVCYDKLFHKVALEKELIKPSMEADKVLIRNHLREKNKDYEFTLMQGEVYGNRILEAEPSPGMLTALKNLADQGVEMKLISHKTKFPIKGPKYNLHEAAISWLTKYGFFQTLNGLGWKQSQIHFEASKEDKAIKIQQLKCTHYIDDLPEILEMLPSDIKKILYSKRINTSPWIDDCIQHWNELKI